MQDKTFSFRFLQPPDANSVHALWKKMILSAWSFSLIEEALGKSEVIAAGAFLEEKLVSFCLCQIFFDDLCIMGIATEEGYQQKGLGGELISLCLREASLMGIEQYTLEVRESNSSAIGLYEKLGFKIAGKRKDYYQNRESALIMSMKGKK